MPVKTYTWVSLWFLLTAPIIAWDVGYCFMRPRSMEGGDLHWIWAPYSIYQNVYGVAALEHGDGFTNAQSLLNEYYCNYCAVGHNSLRDLIQYWIIPNGFWLVVPSFIVWRLGKDLVADLNLAHAASVKAASGKSK
ncbi:hypothetical protein B0H14DRAFT_2779466 [Mycena olivaceomarginata]|nr:hypothetical protein B0H14DRAFT_2779466 [Mycena olivaceomarginata]